MATRVTPDAILARYDDGDHQWTSDDNEQLADALRKTTAALRELREMAAQLRDAYIAFYGGDFAEDNETTEGERAMVSAADVALDNADRALGAILGRA